MLEIEAQNKYLDLLKSRKGFLKVSGLFLVALGLTLLSYYLYYNLLITFTLGVSTLIIMFLMISPPRKIKVVLDEENIFIDKVRISVEECDSWAVADLGEIAEIMIEKAGVSKPTYFYFYVKDGDPKLSELVNELAQLIPYNEENGGAGGFHSTFRVLGLQ